MVSLSILEATCLVLSLGDPLDQMWCLVSLLWQLREEESILAHGLRREAHTQLMKQLITSTSQLGSREE